jgi:hypothetical protein
MLLPAVVEQALLFTYVNTGAPRNIGDAGLYRRSSLCAQMQEGLLDCMPVQLRVRADRLSRVGPLPNRPFEISAGPGPAGTAVVSPR